MDPDRRSTLNLAIEIALSYARFDRVSFKVETGKLMEVSVGLKSRTVDVNQSQRSLNYYAIQVPLFK